MSRMFLTALDLAKNELQNARVQNLASAPGSPVKGQIYMNTSDNTMYWWDGSAWQAAKSGAPAAHASTHNAGGGDALAIDSAAATGSLRTLGTGAAQAAVGNHNHLLNSLTAPNGAVAMNNQLLSGLATPVSGTDAATKAYVDGVIEGLDVLASVKVATTANITLSGTQTIDGVAVAANDRVLVKNQSTASGNGIYLCAAGAWTRTTDFDAWAEIPGSFVFVEQGSTQADTGWVSTADQGGTLNTTAITWTQFSSAGAVTAGAGMTQSGQTLNVIAANGSIVVGADDVQVGFAGTGSAVTAAKSDHTHAPTSLKYSVSVGGATSVVVNHALGTRDVVVNVYRVASPYDTVECDVERTDTANVTVRFATAPAASEYRCVVLG